MFYSKDTLLISPDKRPDYQKIKDYPEVVILGHSSKWPDILTSVSNKDPNIVVLNHTQIKKKESVYFQSYGRPIVYIYTSEGSLSLHTEIVKVAFNGAKYIINIGCSGGLNDELNIGDIVICKNAIRDSGFGNLLASPDQTAECSSFLNSLLLNSAIKLRNNNIQNFPKSKIGNVWCVNSLYYRKENALRAKEKGCDIVEMEAETGAITTGWLNYNFFNDRPIQYSQISYVSDKVPINTQGWTDIFANGESYSMIKGKIDSLFVVLDTFKNSNI